MDFLSLLGACNLASADCPILGVRISQKDNNGKKACKPDWFICDNNIFPVFCPFRYGIELGLNHLDSFISLPLLVSNQFRDTSIFFYGGIPPGSLPRRE